MTGRKRIGSGGGQKGLKTTAKKKRPKKRGSKIGRHGYYDQYADAPKTRGETRYAQYLAFVSWLRRSRPAGLWRWRGAFMNVNPDGFGNVSRLLSWLNHAGAKGMLRVDLRAAAGYPATRLGNASFCWHMLKAQSMGVIETQGAEKIDRPRGGQASYRVFITSEGRAFMRAMR